MRRRRRFRLFWIARQHGLADAKMLLEQQVAHVGAPVEIVAVEENALAQEIDQRAQHVQDHDIMRGLVDGDVKPDVDLGFPRGVGEFMRLAHPRQAILDQRAIRFGGAPRRQRGGLRLHRAAKLEIIGAHAFVVMEQFGERIDQAGEIRRDIGAGLAGHEQTLGLQLIHQFGLACGAFEEA